MVVVEDITGVVAVVVQDITVVVAVWCRQLKRW
jgi:hypothetical protein